MGNKGFLILLGVTILIATAAFFVYASRAPESVSGDENPRGKLYPQLETRLNEVARVTIAKGGQTIELERTDTGWAVASSGSYPAKYEPVKGLLMQIAQLEPVEEKTSNPELYSRIGVEDPAPGSESAKVTIRDASGAELAAVIIGQASYQSGKAHTYVRKADEETSWLAEGEARVDLTLSNWLESELTRLAPDRLQSVTVTHPGSAPYTLSRPNPAQNTFDLVNPPEGRSLTSPAAGSPITSSLRNLDMAAVLPADQSPADFNDAVTAQFRTFDNLAITVRTAMDDEGKVWATLSASAPEAEAEAAQDAAEKIGDAEEGTEEEAPEPDPAAEVRAEASEMNEKFSGWVFQIDEWKATNLRKRFSEITNAPAMDPGHVGPMPSPGPIMNQPPGLTPGG